MTRKGSQVRVLYGPPKKVLVRDARGQSGTRNGRGRRRANAATTTATGRREPTGSVPSVRLNAGRHRPRDRKLRPRPPPVGGIAGDPGDSYPSPTSDRQ